MSTMSRFARRTLRLAVIVGVACAVALAGVQLSIADAPARKPTADPCALTRPEMIQTLVPHTGPPETGSDVSEIDKSAWCKYSGWTTDRPTRDMVSLWFAIVHHGRGPHGSPSGSAHTWVKSIGGCLNCRQRPTPERIGAESYEYGHGYDHDGRHEQFAEVWVRLGATTITVHYVAERATLTTVFESARTVAQEVTFRCATAC
jgi:hypothetical protein